MVCFPSYTGKWAIDQAVPLYRDLSFMAFRSLDNTVNFGLWSDHFEDCNFDSGCGRAVLVRGMIFGEPITSQRRGIA